MNLWQIMIKGGPVMWLILMCSLVSMAVIFEKIFYFLSISGDAQSFKVKVFDLIKQNKIKDAVLLCEKSPLPVAKIIKAGVMKFGSPRDILKEEMEGASHWEILQLERNLVALVTVSHIAPLLGLLGTVVGMTNSFYIIQTRAAALNPLTQGDIAGGIWQALLTTIFGLAVAVPTTLAYNFLVVQTNHFIGEMERAAMELINLLSQLSDSRI